LRIEDFETDSPVPIRIPQSTMPLHTTNAIIIGSHDLAEADRILVFYTESAGKVRAVAEGARRLRSKFGGNVQLFSQGRLVYFERPNKTLHKVNEFVAIRPHQLLREDLDRIALASTVVEAVGVGVEEGEPAPDLFHLLGEALDQMETAARPALVLPGFLLQLLRILGYRPEFSTCVRCRGSLVPQTEAHLSPIHGGLLCTACRSGAVDAFAVSRDALGFLRGAGGTPLRLMDRIALPPATVCEVMGALHAFVRQALGRPLRSADFLGRL
jgi:DNA repair protein RecO (recombination protein O)